MSRQLIFDYLFILAVFIQLFTAIGAAVFGQLVIATALIISMTMMFVSYFVLNLKLSAAINEAVKYAEADLSATKDNKVCLETQKNLISKLFNVTECFYNFKTGKIQMGNFINEMQELLGE